MIDSAEVERRTGWRVVAYPVVASTNDEIAALRDAGAAPRVVVVADRQSAGRGRGGRRFESPPGGLYVSLLVSARTDDLPAPLVAAVAVALAEAIEAEVGVAAQVKWPNDVWLAGRKVAGILTEASIGAAPPQLRTLVTVGVGVNVVSVPADLPPEVAAGTTALDLVGEPAKRRTPTRREDLLVGFLRRLDERLAALERADARSTLEAAYRARLALCGERVGFHAPEGVVEGVLLDASVDRGLLVRDPSGVERWWSAAVVRDVRPAKA
jgi:BirA family biotin operon repressor/biotin-[acetyl-CoA-carboxylase] ligase